MGPKKMAAVLRNLIFQLVTLSVVIQATLGQSEGKIRQDNRTTIQPSAHVAASSPRFLLSFCPILYNISHILA